jgi:hypothetical protein
MPESSWHGLGESKDGTKNVTYIKQKEIKKLLILIKQVENDKKPILNL